MKYIILDLEWNQSNTGLEAEVEKLPFEIIEIGAIELNDSCVMVREFSELVSPLVYHEMHQITGRLLHMHMRELERGKPFPEVMERFLQWCGGEEYRFCTWGVMDLTELQRNMEYYKMPPLSQGPIPFLDIQKLFTIAYEEDRTVRRNLEYAIDYLKIEKDIPFHRAFSDAYYAGKILTHLIQNRPELLTRVSYDVYHPPKDKKSEIKVQFDTYAKYISRQFDSKNDALCDWEVISSKCYLCHCNLRKRVKWFTPNGRHYYCVAYCDKHGFLKGKIRVRKTEGEKVYIVKTTRFITPEEAEEIVRRREHAKEVRKRRKHKEGEVSGNFFET